MEFWLFKCAVVRFKRAKRGANSKRVEDPDTEGYKYLGMIALDTMLCNEIREKTKEVYTRRFQLLPLKSTLNDRNMFYS